MDAYDDILWKFTFEGVQKTAPLNVLLNRVFLEVDSSDRKNPLADRGRDPTAGNEPEADVTVGGRGKDRTKDFQDIADDRSIRVVRLAAGVHVVKEPVVFPHHVTFIGPRSAGGTK